MKISFIIPSYQQGSYIGKCLDSILEQGLEPSRYEVIVVDGGSTDQTLELLKHHPLQPKWTSQSDGGQANALNRGMREATGDLIAWINSDDFYLPDALATVLDKFHNNPSCRVLYGNAIRVDAQGSRIMDYPVEDWNYDRLIEKCFLCQPATFFLREVLLDHGYLNEHFHLALDLEFWLRIGRHEPFLRIPEFLAAAREYSTNKSHSFPLRMQVEALRAGYMHSGMLSKKRLWAIAENIVFLHNKGLKKALRNPGNNPFRHAYFWICKILSYLRLRAQAWCRVLPWHHLEHGKPLRNT